MAESATATAPAATYDSRQAIQICNITLRQFQHWIDIGLVRPAMHKHEHRLTAQDLRRMGYHVAYNQISAAAQATQAPEALNLGKRPPGRVTVALPTKRKA